LGFEFCVVLSRPRYWQPIPNDNADSRGTTKIKARGGRVALPRDRRGMSGARPLRGTLWLDVTRASPPQQLAATQNAKPKTQNAKASLRKGDATIGTIGSRNPYRHSAALRSRRVADPDGPNRNGAELWIEGA
jgi:hypothetical protein